MTNTALLIIATMIVAILVQTVVNIALSNSNMKLNESLDKIEFKLKTAESRIWAQNEEIERLKIQIEDAKEQRDFVIKQKKNLLKAIYTLPKDTISYIERMTLDD